MVNKPKVLNFTNLYFKVLISFDFLLLQLKLPFIFSGTNKSFILTVQVHCNSFAK